MNVRDARLAAGLTQAELARAAGVAQPNLSAYETGRRTPTPAVLARIERALRVRPAARVTRHRKAILAAVAAHHAREPRLVGSAARGDDTPESDVDILVEFTDTASLLDEVGLRLALTELVGVPVDVLDAGSLRGPMRERVLAEAVAI